MSEAPTAKTIATQTHGSCLALEPLAEIGIRRDMLGQHWPARCFVPVGMRVYITGDTGDRDADGCGIGLPDVLYQWE